MLRYAESTADRVSTHLGDFHSDCYWRLKQHTDAKRAIVGLARKLCDIYSMLKTNRPYDEKM